LGLALWAFYFLPIKVSNETIPTIINGITSSVSIIVGFCGVVIGVMFRQLESTLKERLFVSIILPLGLLITMLWVTFSFLTMGLYDFAIRWSLFDLILSVYTFLALVILFAKELIRTREVKAP
jgi:hypothetical protein